MPNERAACQPRLVAIDITRSQLRTYADGRVLRCPMAVFGDEAGRLAFGEEAVRLGQAAPSGLESSLLDWVDDGHLALGSRLYVVSDLLAALLADSVGQLCGVGQVPDLIVLTVPGYWGGPRRGVLEHATAGLARRVELASSTTAILAGALLDYPDLDLRKVVVVEQEHDRVIAAQVLDPPSSLPKEGTDAGALVAMLTSGDADAASVLGLVARAAGPGLPASAVVITPRGNRECSAAQWSGRQWGAAHVRVVDSDCALRGAVEFAKALSGQV